MDACQLLFAGGGLEGCRVSVIKHGAGVVAREGIGILEEEST
jgi:hypothetical protein